MKVREPECKACREHYEKYPLVEIEDVLKGGTKLVHRYNDWHSSSPKECAFVNGVFTPDNWGCQTMIRLRALCGEWEEDFIPEWARYWCRSDLYNGSIGVLWLPEDSPQRGYLVMNWYKSRGRTDKAYIMVDDSKPPELLTLETAEFALDYYTKEYDINWEKT